MLTVEAGNRINTPLYRQFARLYNELLHPKHPSSRDDEVKWTVWVEDGSGGAQSRSSKN